MTQATPTADQPEALGLRHGPHQWRTAAAEGHRRLTNPTRLPGPGRTPGIASQTRAQLFLALGGQGWLLQGAPWPNQAQLPQQRTGAARHQARIHHPIHLLESARAAL